MGLKEGDHFQREGFLMIGRSVPYLESILIGLIVAKLQAGHQERERLKLQRGRGFPDGLGDGWR